MVCRLAAPSYYLNQYWNIVISSPWNKIQWNRNRNLLIFIQKNALENVVRKMAANLSRPHCVNHIWIAVSGNTHGRQRRAVTLTNISTSEPDQTKPRHSKKIDYHLHDFNPSRTRFSTRTVFSGMNISLCQNETAMEASYLYKTASLYWDCPLVKLCHCHRWCSETLYR